MSQQIFVMNHPLVKHKISLLRDKSTGVKEFREMIGEITMLMCYEATRDLPLKEVEIETPVAIAKTQILSGRKMAVIPILRSGIGMADGVTALIPAAKIGHIGLYRNPETFKPVKYYSKLPRDINDREVIVLDLMVATGETAVEAVNIIKQENPKSIKFMSIIASRTGAETLTCAHPDVPLYCAALDEEINEQGYIIPGMGDAGDRLFGTR